MSNYLDQLPPYLRDEVSRLFEQFYNQNEPPIAGATVLGLFTSGVVEPLGQAIEQAGQQAGHGAMGSVVSKAFTKPFGVLTAFIAYSEARQNMGWDHSQALEAAVGTVVVDVAWRVTGAGAGAGVGGWWARGRVRLLVQCLGGSRVP
jgi:hypothetical protein